MVWCGVVWCGVVWYVWFGYWTCFVNHHIGVHAGRYEARTRPARDRQADRRTHTNVTACCVRVCVWMAWCGVVWCGVWLVLGLWVDREGAIHTHTYIHTHSTFNAEQYECCVASIFPKVTALSYILKDPRARAKHKSPFVWNQDTVTVGMPRQPQ